MWISAEFALLVSDWVENWLTAYQNPIQQSTSSFEAVAKAYIESSQSLNRTIHTAIHQQTDTLREALKVLESNNNPVIVAAYEEYEQQEQGEETPNTTMTISIDQIKLPPSQPRRYEGPV
jgi:ParB family chromosome partitioning protein